MIDAIKRAVTATKLLLQKRRTRTIAWVSAVVYLLIYLLAIGDLAFHNGQPELSVRVSRDPLDLLFKQIAYFYFEAIAVVRLPFVTFLFSPINLLFALVLSMLVGLNIALSYITLIQPKVCYGKPSVGLLSSLPALLAGTACCGPLLLIVLGIQASAALVALFGLLVPMAIVLLTSALIFNGKRTRVDYLKEME